MKAPFSMMAASRKPRSRLRRPTARLKEKVSPGLTQVPLMKDMAVSMLLILARLEENPFQFPVDLEIDLPGRTYRKAIFAKWFKVLFQVKYQRVYIDGIIDCRRDPAAIDF